MERLRRRDLRALREFLGGCYVLRDLDAFATHSIRALPKLVPSDIIAYNEADPRKRRVTGVVEPPDVLNFPDSRGIFERHVREHPLITHYQRTGDGRAHKISDFLTQARFRRLGLYNEFYRRINVEYLMAFPLPASRPSMSWFVLNRRRRDFSERDRLVLNLARPHLMQAYRNAEVVTQLQSELALLRHGMDTMGQGVVVLTREGQVRLMTARARQLVAEYFWSGSRGTEDLPETLRRWWAHQETLLTRQDDVPAPLEPLVVEREAKRLEVRRLSHEGESLLLLGERWTALQPASLEPLGLTRREAEVLAWVSEGKTDAEIAAILGTSPHTVGKQLERIYQKLGVENRTAAAALALRAAT